MRCFKANRRAPGVRLMTGILISLWSIAAVYGLDPTRNLSQYNCRTWTRENGLPVNGINSIAQSDDGYLWIGTSAGLVRFDGAEFKLIDLQHVPQLRNTIVTSMKLAVLSRCPRTGPRVRSCTGSPVKRRRGPPAHSRRKGVVRG